MRNVNTQRKMLTESTESFSRVFIFYFTLCANYSFTTIFPSYASHTTDRFCPFYCGLKELSSGELAALITTFFIKVEIKSA